MIENWPTAARAAISPNPGVGDCVYGIARVKLY